MGAKLSKNHLVLHVPTYMKLWGPPTGWDSGTNESHHKTEVKVPAKNTQRRQVSFLKQVSERYDEHLLIQKAECQFFGFKKQQCNNLPPNLSRTPVGVKSGATFTIGFNCSHQPAMRWDNCGYNSRVVLPQELLNYCTEKILPHLIFHEDKEKVLHGFTELKITLDTNRQIFRAHPCFRSSSGQVCDVWYDWAYFLFNDNQHLPCQILTFLQIGDVKNENVTVDGISVVSRSLVAVVREFINEPSSIRNSFHEDCDYSQLIKWGQV